MISRGVTLSYAGVCLPFAVRQACNLPPAPREKTKFMSTDASIDALWASYQTDGYAALSNAQPAGADASFYLALLAYGHQDITRAAQLALDASTQQPANPVYKEAAIHLQRVMREGKQAVSGGHATRSPA